MEYPKCKTCKWWNNEVPDIGECDSPEAGVPTVPLTGSMVASESGCIYTATGYGCINHEPKDQ